MSDNAILAQTLIQLQQTKKPPEPEPEVEENAYLSDVSPKDKPWDEHRASADAIQEYYRDAGKWYGRYLRMQECAQWLAMAWVWEYEKWNHKLHDTRFCRVPGCPTCARQRARMWVARMLKALPELRAKYPTARWVFLSLTLRNCPVDELGATLTAMSKAWDRFSRRKEFKPVLGWVKAVEVTKNHKTDYAHPHLHALLMVRPGYFGPYYVTQARYSELWQESLRVDYTPVVDVRAVKDKPEDLRRAIGEVLKYSLKPSDLADDKEWFLSAMGQLFKRRLVMSGGVLKGILRENEEARDEEMMLLDEGPRESDEAKWIVYDWRREVKRYQRSKNKLVHERRSFHDV